MESLPNDEQKEFMNNLVQKVIAYFTEHNKYGDVIQPDALARAVEAGSLRNLWTAVNIVRMNGMLICQNSTGLFIAKNKEQYDIWWQMYMKPSMQTLVAIQRGMMESAQKLPRLLKYVDGVGEDNEPAQTG